MKTNIKKTSLLCLLSVLFLCCFGIFAVLFSANSDTAMATSKFTMRGASIRYDLKGKDDAIRFHVVMDKTQYDALGSKQTGLLIIPEYKLSGATLDVNTADAYNTLSNGTLTWSGIYQPVAASGETSTDMEAVVAVKGYTDSTYYNTRLVVRGFVKNDSAYYYTDNIVTKSIADVALEKNISKYLINYTVDFFNANGNKITSQSVKFGEKFTFPSVSVDGNSTFLGWYRRTGGTTSAVWSDNYYTQDSIDRTVTKNMQFKAKVVGDAYSSVVEYSSTIYNKEHVYSGDPSVTYRDGFYYLISVDSNCNIYVAKSRSLEDLLHVGATGRYAQMGVKKIYTHSSSSPLAKEQIWAPELTYLEGKWYVYLSAIPSGQTYAASRMRMYVMECQDQDPTGTWNAPVQIGPSSMLNVYGIDGHAFKYKNQLYYVFSGQLSSDDTAQLYMCTMSNPKTCNNNAARINLDTSSSSWSSAERTRYLKEGPCTVVDGNDLYLVFSQGSHNGDYANNSDPLKDYHLSYYKLTGTNPLTKSHWTNKGTCLQRDTSKNVYTVGHNHFFYNADGTLWTSYHGHIGSSDSGSYLDHRTVFVQPVTVSNGSLSFGGVKTEVSISSEQGGLQKNINVPNAYMVDCGTAEEYYEGDKAYGTLWQNSGKDFTVTTTITRVGSGQYCGGITLYERAGGKTNRLLIGVQKEGNLFLCKDYSRRPLNYKYTGWLWNDASVAKLTVSYTASNKTLKITISNLTDTKTQTHTYTIAQLNALISDKVGNDSCAFDLAFTGNFGIGLGGNNNKCKFTNVLFSQNKDVNVGWDSDWGSDWNPYA